MNDKEMLSAMNLNIKGKFSFLASKINSMRVFSNLDIQYIDCGYKSDTFNKFYLYNIIINNYKITIKNIMLNFIFSNLNYNR